MLTNERKLTRFDFFKKTKRELKLRCADHGLLTTGKKADLIERLFDFLHPHSSFEHLPEEDDEGSSSDEEGVDQQSNEGSVHHPKSNELGFNSQSHSTRACSSESGEHPREAYNSATVSPMTFISNVTQYTFSHRRWISPFTNWKFASISRFATYHRL